MSSAEVEESANTRPVWVSTMSGSRDNGRVNRRLWQIDGMDSTDPASPHGFEQRGAAILRDPEWQRLIDGNGMERRSTRSATPDFRDLKSASSASKVTVPSGCGPPEGSEFQETAIESMVYPSFPHCHPKIAPC